MAMNLSTTGDVETPPAPDTPTDTPTAGVNRPLANGGHGLVGGGGGGGGDNAVASTVRKWKREEFREKCVVALRVATCVLSLTSAIVMATNKHGDWKEFQHYEEYRYLLAIGILAFLYALVQLFRFGSARDFVPKRHAGTFDFAGDQIAAYLLMSALSAAIPITNRMREGADNMFTDASAAAISMAFFAFAAMAVSALISGYKLTRQAYI